MVPVIKNRDVRRGSLAKLEGEKAAQGLLVGFWAGLGFHKAHKSREELLL
jgi:hypothetical protein